MIDYRRESRLLKAMAHPVRLQILHLLRDAPECVCHLSAALGKSQPYVSQQLAVLRAAGVIRDEKDGTNVYYRLADDRMASRLAAALGPAAGAGHRAVTGCHCPKCADLPSDGA